MATVVVAFLVGWNLCRGVKRWRSVVSEISAATVVVTTASSVVVVSEVVVVVVVVVGVVVVVVVVVVVGGGGGAVVVVVVVVVVATVVVTGLLPLLGLRSRMSVGSVVVNLCLTCSAIWSGSKVANDTDGAEFTTMGVNVLGWGDLKAVVSKEKIMKLKTLKSTNLFGSL